VRDPPVLIASEVASPHKRESCTEMWKRIYVNPELYTQYDMMPCELKFCLISSCFREENAVDIALQEIDEEEGMKSRASSGKKRRDSYDYFDAVQLLGTGFHCPYFCICLTHLILQVLMKENKTAMTHQASREPTYLSSICGICECET
jgi:hypothetical protein